MDKIDIHQPHDSLFKYIFKDMKEAAAFLQKNLASPMLEEIDLKSLRLESSSYVNDELQKSYSDKLLSANSKKKPDTRIYILIELQVKDIRKIIIRTQAYNIRIKQQHMRAYHTTQAPTIINMIIYSGQKPYQGPRTILENTALPHITLKNLQNNLVVDLHSKTLDKILEDREASLPEILLKYGEEGGFYHLEDCKKEIQRIKQALEKQKDTIKKAGKEKGLLEGEKKGRKTEKME